MPLTIVPLTLDEANAFVRSHHRHHAPVPGAKFCIGVARAVTESELDELGPFEFLPGGHVPKCVREDLAICGIAIVGRPVSRMLDDGWTLEVTRTCTDGTKNANSKLYGACWRVTRELGYRVLGTYTLPDESGASLRAAGWVCLGSRGGGPWSRGSRPRIDTHPLQVKLRWEITSEVPAS